MNGQELPPTPAAFPFHEEAVSHRAPLDVRILAGVLDFLIIIFLGLLLSQYEMRTVMWTAEFVGIVLYRRVFGASPGQQLVGIREERDPLLGRIVVTARTRGTLWFRGAVAAILIVYSGLTFCVGTMFARLTNEKLDSLRVAVLPVDIAKPAAPIGGARHDFERVSLMLPRTLGAYAAEEILCCTMYGGESGDDRLEPGVLVAAMPDVHPYDYCGGVASRGAAWLAGCGETPVQYQRRIELVTPSSRHWILGPVGVVRTNFSLIAKNLYFEEMIPEYGLRRFRSGTAEVVWMRGKRTVKKTKESVEVEIDRFLIADAKSYGAVDIVWKKVPRDERLAQLVASTIALRQDDADAAGREAQAATTGDARLHLTNAFRMNRKNVKIAERLREELALESTAREKRSFARIVSSEAEKNPELQPLAAAVAKWK